MDKKTDNKLKIIPLGGLGEIGKNMTLLEVEGKILVIDMGFKMPGEDMPGIDYIVPDISCLKGREKDIVGVVFTHGHYDHIGAIPYLLDRMGNPPIFAGPLAMGIIIKRQEDFALKPKLDITEVNANSKIKLGPFNVEFFHMNHSIVDNFGIFIETSAGNIVHSSDFKFDINPVNDKPTDFKKLREISSRKIHLLMIDSTGAETEGHSLSEKTIMNNLEEIFIKSKGRIIAATFASLVNRIQQLIMLSEKYGRKVVIEGNGMKTNVEICRNLKYLSVKKGTIIKNKDISDYPDEKITIICTGAQGEERAALTRITNKENKYINFKKGDSIIFSSSIVPGNERAVQSLKDDILRQGTKVFHYKMMDIHAGGHAHREEIEEMIRIINPKFLMPVHGQYSMLVSLKELAIEKIGFSEKNIVIAENGSIVNFSRNNIALDKKTVSSEIVMVDGLGIGDVGEVVMRDRKSLAENGMFVIIAVVNKQKRKINGSPDIISRGFIYLRESKGLLFETRKKVVSIINKSAQTKDVDWSNVKDEIKNKVGQFLYQKTERKPIILPVIIEI
jgi:ribonuclease J